jgi:hypothetical protein
VRRGGSQAQRLVLPRGERAYFFVRARIFCSCPTSRVTSLPFVRVCRSRSSLRSPTCAFSEEPHRAGSAAFRCSPGWRRQPRAPSRIACGTTTRRSGACTGSAPPARSREPIAALQGANCVEDRAAQLPPRNSRRASRADTPCQFFHAQPVVPLLLTPRPCRVAFFCNELRAPHRGTSLGPFVCGARACSLCSFTTVVSYLLTRASQLAQKRKFPTN